MAVNTLVHSSTLSGFLSVEQGEGGREGGEEGGRGEGGRGEGGGEGEGKEEERRERDTPGNILPGWYFRASFL